MFQSHKSQVIKVSPHRHLPPRCQRCWILHDHGALALMLVSFALVLPNVSAYCVSVYHCVGYYTYLPSRQSGKSMVAEAVCATVFSKAPATPFQRSLANYLLPPSLPPEPMLRGSQPQDRTCHLVVPGFLHSVEPQAPLPAGYRANCISCIADPVHSANCLAVHTVHTVC